MEAKVEVIGRNRHNGGYPTEGSFRFLADGKAGPESEEEPQSTFGHFPWAHLFPPCMVIVHDRALGADISIYFLLPLI